MAQGSIDKITLILLLAGASFLALGVGTATTTTCNTLLWIFTNCTTANVFNLFNNPTYSTFGLVLVIFAFFYEYIYLKNR